MDENLIVYLDGEYLPMKEATVPLNDHGLLYGDGIFEGIRAYNGRVFKLQEHVRRFQDCARAIMLDLPLSFDELCEIVRACCEKNDLDDGYIRLVATRGSGDLGIDPRKCPKARIFCIAATITLYPAEMYETGISVITAQTRRNNTTILDPQIKSLNYLNNILAKMEANQAGAQEAVMLAANGVVAECTGQNIFIIRDKKIYTPPVYVGALDGITRQTIIEIARGEGYSVEEKEFTLFNIYNADECFITGTAAECMPITKADNRTIGSGVAGEITKKILSLFQSYVRENGVKIR